MVTLDSEMKPRQIQLPDMTCPECGESKHVGMWTVFREGGFSSWIECYECGHKYRKDGKLHEQV